MRILITGDRGFVGSATRNRILREELHSPMGFDLMDGYDIRDLNMLEECVKEWEPDRILHLAAIARFSEADADPRRAFDTNALGTKNISYVASKYHIPVVYASTGSVYMPIEQEPPITEDFKVRGNSVYGCSKAIGEKYIQECTSPWIILRYAHLYGKEKRHHGLIGGFMDRIDRGLAPTLYGGKQSNDFTYVDDVVEANIKALEAPFEAWNQDYNIGTGEELTTEAAGKIICDVAGYEGKIVKKDQRTVDPGRFVYDCSKAENLLKFKARYSFEEGLTAMFGSTLDEVLGGTDDSPQG